MKKIAFSCLTILAIAVGIFSFIRDEKPPHLDADIAVSAPPITEPKARAYHSEIAKSLLPANEPENERDRRVQDQLDNFIKKTSHITSESVARERERIAQGLKNAQSKKTEMPQIRHEVDEQGEGWEELRFSDGVVRYLPVPEEENKL